MKSTEGIPTEDVRLREVEREVNAAIGCLLAFVGMGLLLLMFALMAVAYAAARANAAPAPIPPRAVRPLAVTHGNVVGTWKVQYDGRECEMTFDANGDYREVMGVDGINPTRFVGLWRWHEGALLVVCHLVEYEDVVHVHKWRLKPDWTCVDSRTQCNVLFKKKVK